VAALGLGLAGCSSFTSLFTNGFITNGFSGDPDPIYVDSSTGAVLIGVCDDLDGPCSDDGNSTIRTGVLDIMSPVTVIDPGAAAVASESDPDLYVYGATAGEGGLTTPRAEIDEPTVLSLHLCATDDCDVGTGDAPAAISALVGANALSGDAVRLRLVDDEIFILADIAGGDFYRTLMCDAVMTSPYQGGGTMLVGGTELAFSNYRPTMGACLAYHPYPDVPQSERGADALLVISTSLGISILGTTAYENYRHEQDDAPPDVADLPTDSVYLPSGLVTGHRATIPTLALVGPSGKTPRSPCRNLYANHLFTDLECAPGDRDDPCATTADVPFRDEPCDTDHTCDAPSAIELQPPAGIDMLIVDDADQTLQALRAELRPNQPEVDGILGTDALRQIELDADYPHDRILGRCTDPVDCSTRPEITGVEARPDVQNCVHAQPFGG
jgi:hypothetical protein